MERYVWSRVNGKWVVWMVPKWNLCIWASWMITWKILGVRVISGELMLYSFIVLGEIIISEWKVCSFHSLWLNSNKYCRSNDISGQLIVSQQKVCKSFCMSILNNSWKVGMILHSRRKNSSCGSSLQISLQDLLIVEFNMGFTTESHVTNIPLVKFFLGGAIGWLLIIVLFVLRLVLQNLHTLRCWIQILYIQGLVARFFASCKLLCYILNLSTGLLRFDL